MQHPTGKRYYPNLQCFIVGTAACGKGIANLALDFVSKVHEALPLVIPGDSSYPGFYRRWKEHVQTSESPMPFLNFIRAVLIREV